MQIAVIGDGLLVEALRDCGAQVRHLAPDGNPPFPLAAWRGEELLRAISPAETVLFSGAISPVVFPADLNGITNPVAFFIPDSPLHRFWMRRAAPAFSLLLTDQPQDARWFQSRGVTSEWLPLAADPRLYHPGERSWDERDLPFLFVGTVDDTRRLKRSALLAVLRDECPLTLIDGNRVRGVPAADVANAYRRARIVVNENMFPSVNLRLFEAMACGALVLTEYAEGHWQVLFRDGEHLVSFAPANLRAQLKRLQTAPAADLARIARTGCEATHHHHLLRNRAETLLGWLRTMTMRPQTHPAWKFAGAPLRMALRWQEHPQRAIWLAGAEPLLGEPSNFDASAWLDRAALLHLIHRDDAIVPALREAIHRHPDALRLRIALAAQLFASDRRSAISQLRFVLRKQSLSFDGNRLRRESAYCHFVAAQTLERLGYDYDAGFDRSPLPPMLWNAMEHYRYAVQCNPEDEMFRLTFASFLAHINAVEEAGRLLEQASRNTPAIAAMLGELANERYH